MLVLTRKVGDVITIGDDIKVIVVAINGKQVRIGIEADRSTAIHRGEIYQKIKNDLAATSAATPPSQPLLEKTMTAPVTGLQQSEKKTVIIRKRTVKDTKIPAEAN